MTYITGSNSVGVPSQLIIPDCTPTTVTDDGTVDVLILFLDQTFGILGNNGIQLW